MANFGRDPETDARELITAAIQSNDQLQAEHERLAKEKRDEAEKHLEKAESCRTATFILRQQLFQLGPVRQVTVSGQLGVLAI